MDRANHRWNKLARRSLGCALLLWVFAAPAVGTISAQDVAPVEQSGTVTDEQPGFVWQLVTNLFNSRALMETLAKPEFVTAAFIALNVIVFVETGLLVGFFLPGDSLLVTAGMIASNPTCGWPLPLLLVTLCLSAIVGDTLGYVIGLKTGPKIFSRDKSLFFNKDHLLKAQQFYERHGGKTIILARFVPILRTFAPVVAGVGKMEYRQFLFFNVFGGTGWVLTMVLFGYFLPDAINPLLRSLLGRPEFLVQDHIEKVVILVVLLSISPGIFAWLRSRVGPKPTPQRELAEAAK